MNRLMHNTVMMLAFGVFVSAMASDAIAVKRTVRFKQRPGKFCTITNYIYTNSISAQQHEALDGSDPAHTPPYPVPAGTGTSTLTTDVPFNPNDLHLVYKFSNSDVVVHHSVWKPTPGGTMRWKRMAFKEGAPGNVARACTRRVGSEWVTECCAVEFDCSAGESCPPGEELTCPITDEEWDVDEHDDPTVPAVSEWGLVVLSLLLLTGMAIKFRRRRAASVS